VYAVRRTAGGDAWASLQDAPVPGKPAVSLGMPSLGRPSTSPKPSAPCAI
jgi:tRNA-2-methylthio-N6-dimethylallyladenosine synthase